MLYEFIYKSEYLTEKNNLQVIIDTQNVWLVVHPSESNGDQVKSLPILQRKGNVPTS